MEEHRKFKPKPMGSENSMLSRNSVVKLILTGDADNLRQKNPLLQLRSIQRPSPSDKLLIKLKEPWRCHTNVSSTEQKRPNVSFRVNRDADKQFLKPYEHVDEYFRLRLGNRHTAFEKEHTVASRNKLRQEYY